MYTLVIERNVLNIEKILLSGQVFRYERLSKNKYVLIYKENYVLVEGITKGYLFHCEENDFFNVWYNYLDLGRDYKKINESIVKKQKALEPIVEAFKGMRILQQDSFEMLFTFIVSQSKSMPQIQQLVQSMAKDYGEKIGQVEEKSIYRFPTQRELKHITEETFRQRKFGYRGPYLVAAINEYRVESSKMNDVELKKYLKSIYGVGEKVAACVMLFGYQRHNTFPVDVWIRKIMIHLYEKDIRKNLKNPKVKTISDAHIEAFGLKLFGESAGLAQQYLFEYSRQIF